MVITTWVILIIQSLATTGPCKPYFGSLLWCHWPPDNDDTIILDQDFIFMDSNNTKVVAPVGMVTDGASVGTIIQIPFVGAAVIHLIKGTPMTGPLRPAAIPHDKIYGSAVEYSLWRALVSPERAIADRILYEAAQCGEYRVASKTIPRTPLSKWRAFIVFSVLRIAGVFSWVSDSSKAQKSLVRLHTL